MSTKIVLQLVVTLLANSFWNVKAFAVAPNGYVFRSAIIEFVCNEERWRASYNYHQPEYLGKATILENAGFTEIFMEGDIPEGTKQAGLTSLELSEVKPSIYGVYSYEFISESNKSDYAMEMRERSRYNLTKTLEVKKEDCQLNDKDSVKKQTIAHIAIKSIQDLDQNSGSVILPEFALLDPYFYAYAKADKKIYLVAIRNEDSPSGADFLAMRSFPVQPIDDKVDEKLYKVIIFNKTMVVNKRAVNVVSNIIEYNFVD